MSSEGSDIIVNLVDEDDPDQFDQRNEQIDEYETEDDEVEDEIDEYLQNKGCNNIISATSAVRPKRVLIVVNRTEENMLAAMRGKNSRKRALQKKKSNKSKADYLKREYGSKEEALKRVKENDSSNKQCKDARIIKDDTLAYTLWGGRWVLFCTVCLCAVHAKYAFLIVPSSAAAERVFSVLKHSLSLVQMHMALEDRTELQVKLCYNHMRDKWVDTVEGL